MGKWELSAWQRKADKLAFGIRQQIEKYYQAKKSGDDKEAARLAKIALTLTREFNDHIAVAPPGAKIPRPPKF